MVANTGARIRAFAAALGVSLLAAVATDLGFGAAFVSDHVAWATAAYSTALAVMLVGRQKDHPHFVHRFWVRIPLSLLVTGLCLWLLRGPLLVTLPTQEYVTAGHSPYVVLPLTAVLSVALLMLAERLLPRGQPAPSSDRAQRS